MQIGTLFLGMLIGAVVMWVYVDREGFRDRLAGIRDSAVEHAPSAEQTAGAASALWAFVRKHWLVILVVMVLLIWGISSLIQQANYIPQVHLGLNQFTDKCGKSVTVDLTVEDVRRGYFTVGSTPECRRSVNLNPTQ